jgi:hypothetical protein
LLGTTREYLWSLRAETGRLAAEGQDADAIIATVEPLMRARYPDWGQPGVAELAMARKDDLRIEVLQLLEDTDPPAAVHVRVGVDRLRRARLLAQ